MSLPLSYFAISRSALRHNVQVVRRHIGPRQQVIAVVKANAYGHGIAEVVKAVEDCVDGFQVDDIEELRTIREHTQKRVLVLGYVQPDDLAEVIALNGEICLYDTERLLELSRVASRENPAKVHLKIDALLGRQGLLNQELPEFLSVLKRMPEIEVASIYTHFSNLEDTSEQSHAHKQLHIFAEAVNMIRGQIHPYIPVHTSSTAGTIVFEKNGGEHAWVRLGIGLYGLQPSLALALLDFKPALRWVSHLAQVKQIPAGHPVGYGLTYVAKQPMSIGIVPQGYSDGFDRLLSNKGSVLVHGTRCPVIGRVAMNMIAIDLSEVHDAYAGDEVVLLGTQKNASISAEDIAELTQTINYEVIARLNPLVPRVLVD